MSLDDVDRAKARAWRERGARTWQENRRARAAAPPPKRRAKALRARSTKPSRVAHERAVAAAGRAAKDRDRTCQAVGLIPGHVCWGPLDPQHVIPRGVRRDLAADAANIVAICRGAHLWVDANPDAAEALGLHGRSWSRP